jgi:ABC-type dipeptide/oligopeptide/nickel transport system permease component
MPPLIQFALRRFLLIPLSLLIITMVLYAGVMLTPPEARVTLYLPKGKGRISEQLIARYIATYHLAEPYPTQYFYWVKSLVQGTWGYSPIMQEDVLPALVRRTPATLELTLYALLLFIPLGLASGVLAGWRQYGWVDNIFRALAFLGTSMPPFILALVFMAIFYISLGWFMPERIGFQASRQIAEAGYHAYTGMISLDALLNGRVDIFIEALRHLAMPVLTLSLYNWASLGRVTRSALIEQRRKDFVTSARARGLSENRVVWKHVFGNVLTPALTSIGLSVATILTGAFVVEIIFNLHGISEVLAISVSGAPDAPAALGFSVYSVLMVLGLMFLIDLLMAVFDPRVREEVLRA